MPRTDVVTIPATTLSVGVRGPFESGNLPTDVTEFVCNIVPVPAQWPASGEVMVLSLEESNDAGQTWRFSASDSLGGGVWHDRQGNVLTQETWEATLLFASGSTRRVRLTVDVKQACRVSGSVGVQ